MSRNLVIRGTSSKRLSEGTIRDDMEHIHNLVIIDVVVRGLDVYVATNSVRSCMFARTCMMSRLPYKGLCIEWYDDECAGPLPFEIRRSKFTSKPKQPLSSTKRMPLKREPLVNRFNLLSFDDSVSGGNSEESNMSDDDKESHISGIRLSPRSAASSTSR